MSGTADIHLVVLLDSELRGLARTYAEFLKLKKDADEKELTDRLDAILNVGMQALKHLIADPEAAFVILGSRGREAKP